MDVLAARRPGPQLTGPAGHASGPRVAALVAGAGAGLLAAVWWRGNAPAVGDGAALIDAGRLSGFLAGYVAVLQVVLRARTRPVERTLGTDAINATHRLLGSYLLALIVAHASLITAGYAAGTGTSVTGEVPVLLTGYPYVLWAVVATGLLVVVALTSAAAIRRRMPYGIWHAVHLLVYPALVLTLFHQVANGEHFRHHGWLRLGWLALWTGVGIVILWSRWLRPLALALRHRIVVSTVRPEAGSAVTIELTGRRLDRFPAEAGQYFRWRFLVRGHWFAAHPYSLSAEPDGRRLRITASITRPYGRSLLALPVGCQVVAEGPCGGLVRPRRGRAPIVLIAGGVGITPLRALFATCRSDAVTLIYRVRTDDDVVLRAELDAIADRRDAEVHYLVGPRNDPANDLSASRLEALCPHLVRAQVFVCGSASFVAHVRHSLADAGVPTARLRTESFLMG